METPSPVAVAKDAPLGSIMLYGRRIAFTILAGAAWALVIAVANVPYAPDSKFIEAACVHERLPPAMQDAVYPGHHAPDQPPTPGDREIFIPDTCSSSETMVEGPRRFGAHPRSIAVAGHTLTFPDSVSDDTAAQVAARYEAVLSEMLKSERVLFVQRSLLWWAVPFAVSLAASFGVLSATKDVKNWHFGQVALLWVICVGGALGLWNWCGGDLGWLGRFIVRVPPYQAWYQSLTSFPALPEFAVNVGGDFTANDFLAELAPLGIVTALLALGAAALALTWRWFGEAAQGRNER